MRIGVALTDSLGYTAQPLLTLWRKSPAEDLRNLLRLLRRHAVTVVVVGHPLNMDGTAGPWAARVTGFADELRTRSGLPVHLFDERLTTVEAESLLNASVPQHAGSAERHRRKRVVDQVAAVVLLQDWLQHQQHLAARAHLPPVPTSGL